MIKSALLAGTLAVALMSGPRESAEAGHPFGLQLPWPAGTHRINEGNQSYDCGLTHGGAGFETNAKAIDFEFATHGQVAAVAGGTIVNGTTDPIDNRGNFLEINHGEVEIQPGVFVTHRSRYLHLRTTLQGGAWAPGIGIGVFVGQGQLIGFSGGTGGVDPHLHFDLKVYDGSGSPVTPIVPEPMSNQYNFAQWGICGTAADKNSPAWYPDGDGDGYTEGEEQHIGTNIFDRCDPNTAALPSISWPADLQGGPFSAAKVNLIDLSSFTNPVRRYDTSPPDVNFHTRWDLVTGPGLFGEWINVEDLGALVGGYKAYPPMFGGQTRVFGGPACVE